MSAKVSNVTRRGNAPAAIPRLIESAAHELKVPAAKLWKVLRDPAQDRHLVERYRRLADRCVRGCRAALLYHLNEEDQQAA